MNKNNVLEFRAPGEIRDPLTKLLQQGTRQQIQQAIEAKLALQADSGESAPPSLQQLLMRSSRWAPQQVRIVLAFSVCRLVSHRCRNILSVLSHHHTPH
ncbi:hypothetical protein, partial [Thiolapillus sp.]|uniref:hypothetical protein n=2 Tax=Thiolapillus sp. TaxID=2017437 RepID=UPI003AF48A66